MPKFITSKKKGFTLIEVIVAIGVFALVMISLTNVFFPIQRAWRTQKEGLDLVRNARWALEFMERELREAEAATINTNPGSLPAGQLIRFRLADPPAQPWWYWRGDSASDTIGFGDRSFLYRGQGNNLADAYDTRQQIANFLVAINPIFSNGSGLVTIELTVRPDPAEPAGHNNPNYSLRKQIRPRN